MKVVRAVKWLITIIVLLVSCRAYADSTFIRFGSTWKYLVNGTDPGSSWKSISGVGTETWASGNGKFGYGSGDERTLFSATTNGAKQPVTTYFKTTVNVSNIASFAFFRLRVYLDDAMIVYVNGKEVLRSNITAGPVTSNTFALQENPDNGNVISSFNIPIANVVNGINQVAVEVHQANDKAEDMTFDLELAGITSNNSPVVSRGPLLQKVSTDGITVSWKTSTASTAKIIYGTSENSLVLVVKNEAVSIDHELRLTGLQPDTKYYYAIGTATDILEGSYRNFFITSPPANTTRKIRIGVFGDAGSGDAHQKGTRDSYLRLFKKDAHAELSLMLGDNAYQYGTDQEYQANFFNIYDDNMFDNHVVFPIPGNHEYAAPGVPYFSIFSLPTAGESGGVPSGTESYYSFNYGNIHFVMLNSMGYDGAKKLSDSTGEQAIWLKKDLDVNARTHKWIIACLHHPPYSNGTHSSDGEADLTAIRQQLTPILERYGVDAVLSGHSHVYERSFLIQGHTGLSNTFKAGIGEPGNLVSSSSGRYDGSVNSCPYFTNDTITKKGTVYVVAGSAGLIGGGTNANMPLFYYKNYSGTSGGENGVLYLEVQDNRLDAKFIGLSGIVKDQFTIMKGVNAKRILSAEINKPVNLTASWIGSYNWLPASSAGRDGPRTITIKPDQPTTYKYYVRDSVGISKACITDSFEVRVSAKPIPAVLNFEVSQKNSKIILKWTAGAETIGDYYSIEKSTNGQHFNLLTIIPALVATANSATEPLYEFEDNYPVTGNNFYRLVKLTKDAQTLMTGSRTLNFEVARSFSCNIKSGMGSKNILDMTVDNNKKQSLQVGVFDMNGKRIYYNLFTNEGNFNIRVFLPSGMYVLNITAADKTNLSEKVIIK